MLVSILVQHTALKNVLDVDMVVYRMFGCLVVCFNQYLV